MADILFDAKGSVDLHATLRALQQHKPSVASCKAQLRQRWDVLQAPPQDLAPSALRAWKAARGYELESILLALAAVEGLQPSPPFRRKGEQIDGLLVVDHRPLLLEAKWQEAAVTAAEVFAFQGKLRGKLVGTLGLFVSVGSFSEDAPAAVAYGKEINVLLADCDDVGLALDPKHALKAVVRVKLRQASLTGDVYYPFKTWLDEETA